MLKTIAFLIIFFVGLTLITIFENNQDEEEVKGEKEEKKLTLAYCNDFIQDAIALAEQNDLDLKRLPNSFDVLANLKSGNIDYAVIGRRAYSDEINSEIVEIPMKEYGWTLVSSERDFVEYSDIENLEIHTYLDQEEIQDFFSYEPSFVFHEDIDSAFSSGIALISWEDFRDDFELVIPMQDDTRLEKFRTPILFMRKDARPLENLGL